MAYLEKLLEEIAEGLKNTEQKVLYYLDTKGLKVIKTSKDLAPCITQNSDLIRIDSMLKDILELMEDFAMEQDTEEIQEHLLKVLNNRDRSSAINNFHKALLDYPRSKKNWLKIEIKWLWERALELLDDYAST